MADFADWPQDDGFAPDQREMCLWVARGWPFGLRSTDRGTILIQVGDPEREMVCVPAELYAEDDRGPAMILLAFAYGVVQTTLAEQP